MNTFFVTSRSGIMINPETSEISEVNRVGGSIDDIYIIPEDCNIIYKHGDIERKVEAKAGQMLVTFYSRRDICPFVIIDSKEWKTRIDDIEKKEQEEKEKWAAEKAERCKSCDSCCDPCCEELAEC